MKKLSIVSVLSALVMSTSVSAQDAPAIPAVTGEWFNFQTDSGEVISENKEGNAKMVITFDYSDVYISYQVLSGTFGACPESSTVAPVEISVDGRDFDGFEVPMTSDNYVVGLYKADMEDFFNGEMAKIIAFSSNITITTCNGHASSTFDSSRWPARYFERLMLPNN